MRSEYLEYFLEVVKTGSFNKAGLNLNVTHQTISTAITNLENELNTQLILRTKQGILLTATGEVFLDYARKVLDTIQQSKQAVAQIDANNTTTTPSGHLTILASPFMNVFIIPQLTASFFTKYPNITLQVIEQESEEILNMLQSGKGDLGIFAISSVIAHDETLYKQCQTIDVNTFRLCAVTTATHPLANYKTVSLKTLSQYPLALYQVSDAPNTLQSIFLKFPDTRLHLTTSNFSVYKHCILSGQAVGILPKIKNKKTSLLLPDFEDSAWIPIKDTPHVSLGYSLATNLSKGKEKLCQLFLEEIKHIL